LTFWKVGKSVCTLTFHADSDRSRFLFFVEEKALAGSLTGKLLWAKIMPEREREREREREQEAR
jgi:hypothetical protein